MRELVFLKQRCFFLLAAAAAVWLFPEISSSQEETASAFRRYKANEVSTGYYEEYEVLPKHRRPFIGTRNIRDMLPYSPTSAGIRNRSRLADSHQGIQFYTLKRCENCHIEQTKNIHTVRANLTCRQCHGNEPVAGIEHYYSPMNPIRRHAYVCSKCHEGASASFASYVVHAPNPSLAETKKTFPVLFYAFWIMIAIAAGTFAVFLPHTVLWGIRELFDRNRKGGES